MLNCSEDVDENGVSQTEKYYLRSLSDNVRTQPALLSRDFPTLADDLEIPAFISAEQVFSSVLRLASPQLQLWTHYDVRYASYGMSYDIIVLP